MIDPPLPPKLSTGGAPPRKEHTMNINIDTDYTGDPDAYVHTHVNHDTTKLEAVSYLLTTPETTVNVYDIVEQTGPPGMFLVVKQFDGRFTGEMEPYSRVWRMIGNALLHHGHSQQDQTKAIVQMTKYAPETHDGSPVKQEFGDLENATVIGMTAGSTPPIGVTVTQRVGKMTGGTIIGYDGSTK